MLYSRTNINGRICCACFRLSRQEGGGLTGAVDAAAGSDGAMIDVGRRLVLCMGILLATKKSVTKFFSTVDQCVGVLWSVLDRDSRNFF